MSDGAMFFLLCAIPVVLLLFTGSHRANKREQERQEAAAECERRRQAAIQGFIKGSRVLTPEQFAEFRQTAKNRGMVDITGVYVLHNTTKDMYYIGQATKLYQRVANHFAGRGNGDVYADYKYGDQWTIRLVRLSGSEFDSLDALERHAIQLYDSYNKGYNKTRGNK